MAEALILLPVLTIIFGLVIYMAYRFKTEIDLNQRARQQLWTQAIPGCGSGNLDSQRLAHVATVSSQLPNLAPSISPFLATVLWWQIETRAETQIRRPASLGQDSEHLVSTMRVTCNEVVRPTEANLWLIVQEAFCRSGVC